MLFLLLKILIPIFAGGHICYNGPSPLRCGIRFGLLLLNPPNSWCRGRLPLKSWCSGIGLQRSYYWYYPSCSAMCWRCGLAMFYDTAFLDWGDDVASESVRFVPSTWSYYLQGLFFSGIAKPIKGLISYILLAARRVIALCWLSNTPPPWSRFLQLIAGIRRMEYLTATVLNDIPLFNKIWECWYQSEFATPLPCSVT